MPNSDCCSRSGVGKQKPWQKTTTQKKMYMYDVSVRFVIAVHFLLTRTETPSPDTVFNSPAVVIDPWCASPRGRKPRECPGANHCLPLLVRFLLSAGIMSRTKQVFLSLSVCLRCSERRAPIRRPGS